MWKIPRLEVKAASAVVDVDLIPVFQDGGKKVVPQDGPYRALLERFRKGEGFGARSGQTEFVRFGGQGSSENVLFVGLGQASELTEEKLRQAGAHAWTRLCAEKCPSAAIHLDALLDLPVEGAAADPLLRVRAFAEGLLLGAYRFPKHKSKEAAAASAKTPASLVFVSRKKAIKPKLECDLARVQAVVECVNVARDWSNEPSNIGTPAYFAREAQRLARQFGLKCKVLGEAEAARQKMGLFLGVGQGSAREGKIVVLEYLPRNPARTVAFVGKGITFDSGGISIKPATRMEEMKHDMTGAATVFGATLLAARLKSPNRVVCVMGFTENMPSGDALQPGNVLRSRNGKTVEIINTDAEGRLILADLLDYAQELKPDVCVDAATLTGAIGVALGKHCCGLFSNDDGLEEALGRASRSTGERLWSMPLYDEYFEDMRSETADMKNSCNDSYGGAIRGAIFLKQFVRKGLPWAHLDIATVASNVSHIPYFPKRGASGAIVRTLAQFALDY